MSVKHKHFIPLNICILTVSDTRSAAEDTSGQKLVELVQHAGHKLHEKTLIKDDPYHIRAVVSQWIYQSSIQAIIITGGTGFAGRDNTPQAVSPLFDTTVDGFGELFRQLSYKEIGTSTVQSRALAGLANKTLICCLPGSTGACITGWNGIIKDQLDSTHRPCNFVGQLIHQ